MGQMPLPETPGAWGRRWAHSRPSVAWLRWGRPGRNTKKHGCTLLPSLGARAHAHTHGRARTGTHTNTHNHDWLGETSAHPMGSRPGSATFPERWENEVSVIGTHFSQDCTLAFTRRCSGQSDAVGKSPQGRNIQNFPGGFYSSKPVRARSDTLQSCLQLSPEPALQTAILISLFNLQQLPTALKIRLNVLVRPTTSSILLTPQPNACVSYFATSGD